MKLINAYTHPYTTLYIYISVSWIEKKIDVRQPVRAYDASDLSNRRRRREKINESLFTASSFFYDMGAYHSYKQQFCSFLALAKKTVRRRYCLA